MIRAHDENALNELAVKYGTYCRTVAFNVLGDAEEAEECVNDTWLRVWNAIPPERPKVFHAWLGKITLRLALNRWQKNHSQKRFAGLEELLSELEECIPSGQSMEQQIAANEIARVINRWLDTLSREDRVIFVRRYWHGDAVKKLALERGVSPGKMAKRLYGLRCKLKAALEKEDILV
jgi:RNA polymerase sigma-70 factor (ECF subfamily)